MAEPLGVNEPLSGIRVVEMSVALQGPAAALFLCDMGAEVIKGEPPIGEGSRHHRGANNPLPPDATGEVPSYPAGTCTS